MSQLKDFQIIKKLGDGAFSSVHEVKRISDGAIYALKKVKMGKLSEKEKQNAVNEIRILASINHQNVIGYKEAFFENKEGCLCIIMELADGGDLLQTIEKHKKNRTKFTEKQIWHYYIQIVRGLKALHDLKIVHRDIKCANLFMTKDGVVKLGDLNVSKVAKRGLLQTQTGTPYYASPEVWKDQPYNHLSDIWSLGCVLYEMCILLPPFRAQSMQGLAAKVQKGVYDKIPAHFSADLNQMIKSCLQVTPSNRPSCDKILATPGLLNHMTGTLEELVLDGQEENGQDNLLKTIRCPRNLGMITERLPAPQYKPRIKKSNSLSLDGSVRKHIEVEKENKVSSQIELVKQNSSEEKKKFNSDEKPKQKKLVSQQRRVGASRPINNLPTIVEDKSEDSRKQLQSRALNEMVKVSELLEMPNQLRKVPSKINLVGYNSENRQIDTQKKKSENNIHSIPISRSSERSNSKPPAIPKSAEHYLNKAKAHLINHIPSYKQNYGHNNYLSDNEDASTRVSSKSQIRRNMNENNRHKYQPSIGNAEFYQQVNPVSKTPIHISQKLYVNPQSNIDLEYQQKLPNIKPNLRQMSIDTPAPELYEPIKYERQNIQPIQSARGNSRYQNHRNESLGVSRALGNFSANRYEGVGNALRLARAMSRDNIPTLNLMKQHEPRGPCPGSYMTKVQSIPNIVSNRDIQELRYSEQRGLQAVQYSRRLNHVYSSQEHNIGISNNRYEPPSTRFKQY